MPRPKAPDATPVALAMTWPATNGVTETELKEVIIHLAFYAGWPRAMSAIMVAKEVFAA